MMCGYRRSNSRERLASDMAYTATRIGDPRHVDTHRTTHRTTTCRRDRATRNGTYALGLLDGTERRFGAD
jgi:hypothetical protein